MGGRPPRGDASGGDPIQGYFVEFEDGVFAPEPAAR